MVKLESAVTEMNRLTTAPMVSRRVVKDTTLELRSGTYRFDTGHDLTLFRPTTHLDPEIYADPSTSSRSPWPCCSRPSTLSC